MTDIPAGGGMSIEVVTSWQTLMSYAHALGQARKSGDPQRIAEAERAHDEYKAACLASDRMLMHATHGDLFSGKDRRPLPPTPQEPQ